MELCSNGHEEVCYECRNCPVCEKIDEIKDLENSIAGLEQELEDLKKEQR